MEKSPLSHVDAAQTQEGLPAEKIEPAVLVTSAKPERPAPILETTTAKLTGLRKYLGLATVGIASFMGTGQNIQAESGPTTATAPNVSEVTKPLSERIKKVEDPVKTKIGSEGGVDYYEIFDEYDTVRKAYRIKYIGENRLNSQVLTIGNYGNYNEARNDLESRDNVPKSVLNSMHLVTTQVDTFKAGERKMRLRGWMPLKDLPQHVRVPGSEAERFGVPGHKEMTVVVDPSETDPLKFEVTWVPDADSRPLKQTEIITETHPDYAKYKAQWEAYVKE